MTNDITNYTDEDIASLSQSDLDIFKDKQQAMNKQSEDYLVMIFDCLDALNNRLEAIEGLVAQEEAEYFTTRH
jgi:hypothetical protein